MLVNWNGLTKVELARHLVRYHWCLPDLPPATDERIQPWLAFRYRVLVDEYACLVRQGAAPDRKRAA